MYISDLFGNRIEVTDLPKAIQQADFCSTSPHKLNKLSFSASNDARGKKMKCREGVTVGEYHKDMLTKLEQLNKVGA